MKKSTEPDAVCEACGEPIDPEEAIGRLHPACAERLLEAFRTSRNRPTKAQ